MLLMDAELQQPPRVHLLHPEGEHRGTRQQRGVGAEALGCGIIISLPTA